LGGTGQPGLKFVAQRGQFGQVGIVLERLAQAGLVIAELRCRDPKVALNAVAFGTVAVGQPFKGVKDGPWPVVIAR
jgi:hypothetical protein